MSQLGFESFLENSTPYLTGKRWALATHTSATTAQCDPVVDVLVQSSLPLIKLFSGEHGLRGDAAAGDAVPDHIDPYTELPLISLYGPRYAAEASMFADVDGLIVDFQDIGSRYYTFTATVLSLLIAAHEARVPAYLLDRPNPIGGLVVEGNLLADRARSIVGALPIPIRHGLTLGELFQWYGNQQNWSKDFLHVIPCQGLTGSMLWHDTQLPWVPPSPNATGPIMALLYPGTCLIEGTNFSEGRGTAYPFEIIGAPFVDGHQFASVLNRHEHPGVRFRPITFRPTTSKHAGQICHGVQIHVLNPYLVRSVSIGLDLINTTLRLWPEETEINPFMAKLSGTQDLRSVLHKAEYADVLREFQSQSNDFRLETEEYWLYPRS